MVTTIGHGCTFERGSPPATCPRVLIAVHGHEPQGWLRAVHGALPASALVRVLVVDDVPRPPGALLLPAARRWYGAALAAWRRDADADARSVLEALRADLAVAPEVVRIPSSGDPGRVIAAHAREWPADLVVLARDGRGRLARALLGTVHERAARGARCAVLVIQAAPRPGLSEARPSGHPVQGGVRHA